jgi:RNA polymerase sigma-70 factor (ECF subfamily)
VPATDVDDVTQEVFLVVHDRQQQLTEVARADLWLREISRRVAAAHRRRAHRRREVYVDPPQNLASEGSLATILSQLEDEERLHHALSKLDDESRDLIALHSGNLPLVDVAELLERDRKTVRKRLQAALRKLEILVGRADPAQSAQRPSAPPRPPLERSADWLSAPAFETRILTDDPALTVGLIADVVIAVWASAATVEALQILDRQFKKALETCEGFAYLAIVEATTRPPNQDARKLIVELMQLHSNNIRIYATALQGGMAWIARPIMSGLSLLARPPFPMEFFNGTPAAANWLAANWAGAAAVGSLTLTRAAEKLRQQAMASAKSA